ncbi:MAG: tRNA (adenosine(37)-N6)-threonylcarbamoyltransferase complex ATPase subunit type 1 TsaE [bacterium]|nr:tRNA (adenosine(37)-N6)-threonylcarbamoyltransferase complex ATPase subunit type 1 TsaE [bacterium]
MKTIQSESIDQTFAIAKELVEAHLEPGDLILISGEMGAGKTTFVQGIASAMKIKQTINSPTFTKLHIYTGDWTLNHLDLYNISNLGELESFGIYDYIETDMGVSVVEWWQKFPTIFENLPHWHITISGKNTQRIIKIEARETICLKTSQS